MISPSELPPNLHRELRKRLVETAAKLSASGLRLELPEAVRTAQTAWPEDCPLSEPELRAEVQSIFDAARALEDQRREIKERARELYARLPRLSEPEAFFEAPQSIYYALTDAVSSAADDGLEDLSYIEEKLADTPESLRAAWLGYHLGECVRELEDPEIEEAVAKLVTALCGGRQGDSRHGQLPRPD